MTQTLRPSAVFPDVWLIDRPTFADDRGFFHEYVRMGDLEAAVGRKLNFVQGNHSHSKKDVLRGIHVAVYDKLIYAVRGRLLKVIVDLRPDSPTWLRHEFIELGGEGHPSIFLPPGFGNSFLALSEDVDYLYLVGEYYDPAKEQTVRWNDPDLKIQWPVASPVVSPRDRQAKTVRELFPQKFA